MTSLCWFCQRAFSVRTTATNVNNGNITLLSFGINVQVCGQNNSESPHTSIFTRPIILVTDVLVRPGGNNYDGWITKTGIGISVPNFLGSQLSVHFVAIVAKNQVNSNTRHIIEFSFNRDYWPALLPQWRPQLDLWWSTNKKSFHWCPSICMGR